jgi:hypothetical protein
MYYDPWWGGYNWGYPGYGYGYGAGGYAPGPGYETGAVRLKIKPREAQVFVDGYYAGVVDEFDGAFQRLRLEEGPHTIQVRLDDHEPLEFKVYVVYDRTTTLRGELQRVP